MESTPRASTLIIRFLHHESGDVSGVVERVRTGLKEWFHGPEALRRLIARIVENDEDAGDQSR